MTLRCPALTIGERAESAAQTGDSVFQPSRRHPAVVVIADEIDETAKPEGASKILEFLASKRQEPNCWAAERLGTGLVVCGRTEPGYREAFALDLAEKGTGIAVDVAVAEGLAGLRVPEDLCRCGAGLPLCV